MLKKCLCNHFLLFQNFLPNKYCRHIFMLSSIHQKYENFGERSRYTRPRFGEEHFKDDFKSHRDKSFHEFVDKVRLYVDTRKFEEINFDPETMSNIENEQQKLRLILSEYEIFKSNLNCVPRKLKEEQVWKLMKLKTEKERKNYLNHLFNAEIERHFFYSKRDAMIEEEEILYSNLMRKVNLQKTTIFNENDELDYGKLRNTNFYDINRFYKQRNKRHRLRNASLYGQRIIVDLNFEDYFSEERIIAVMRQCLLLYIRNRDFPNESMFLF